MWENLWSLLAEKAETQLVRNKSLSQEIPNARDDNLNSKIKTVLKKYENVFDQEIGNLSKQDADALEGELTEYEIMSIPTEYETR